jgi:type VI protein secretion system component Hcp
MRYELKDVVISSCTVAGQGGGSGGIPMESLSLNYAKVTTVQRPASSDKKVDVKGWDPPKR